MATIVELKEHLRNGGKIKMASWEEGEWIRLVNHSFVNEEGLDFPFFPEDAFDSDWEVYEEPKKHFEITHTGLYKTRDGRMALVSFMRNSDYGVFGVIDGENYSRFWDRSGEFWTGEENPEDIVEEWKD